VKTQRLLVGLCVAVSAVCAADESATAQSWADKMFEVRKHEFGTVARGSDIEYRFEFKNLYKDPVHIASVRASCGCTTPIIETRTVESLQTGAIIAQFNTRTFTGQKGATITVTIDRPAYAEVQLRVDGYIRSDVVFNPGTVKFANVDQGEVHEKKVRVSYAGRSDWKIKDVRTTGNHLEVEMTEVKRAGGRVEYDLLVRLKDSAAAGYFNNQLILVTDDRKNRIPLDVEGTVIPEISVNPSKLLLGNVAKGGSVTKKLIVKGKHPFRITKIDCGNDCFDFSTDKESKKVHIVNVVYQAGEKPGKIAQQIRVSTDRGENRFATLTAYAQVVEEDVTHASHEGNQGSPSSDHQAAVGS